MSAAAFLSLANRTTCGLRYETYEMKDGKYVLVNGRPVPTEQRKRYLAALDEIHALAIQMRDDRLK